jgi:hypothetical protein
MLLVLNLIQKIRLQCRKKKDTIMDWIICWSGLAGSPRWYRDHKHNNIVISIYALNNIITITIWRVLGLGITPPTQSFGPQAGKKPSGSYYSSAWISVIWAGCSMRSWQTQSLCSYTHKTRCWWLGTCLDVLCVWAYEQGAPCAHGQIQSLLIRS